jgi:hypothetical protein
LKNLTKSKKKQQQALASSFKEQLKIHTGPKTRIDQIIDTLQFEHAEKPHELLMKLGSDMRETVGFLTKALGHNDPAFLTAFLCQWEPVQQKALNSFMATQTIRNPNQAVNTIAGMREQHHQFSPIAAEMQTLLNTAVTQYLYPTFTPVSPPFLPHENDVVVTAVTYDPLKRRLTQDLHLASQLGTLPHSVVYTAENGAVGVVSDIHQHLRQPEVIAQGEDVQENLDGLLRQLINPLFRVNEVVTMGKIPTSGVLHTELPKQALADAYKRKRALGTLPSSS